MEIIFKKIMFITRVSLYFLLYRLYTIVMNINANDTKIQIMYAFIMIGIIDLILNDVVNIRFKINSKNIEKIKDFNISINMFLVFDFVLRLFGSIIIFKFVYYINYLNYEKLFHNIITKIDLVFLLTYLIYLSITDILYLTEISNIERRNN